MKLVRYGNPGKEKPGLIDAEGKLRDLSAVVGDIGPEQLGDAALAKLRKLKVDRLPLVRGKPRFGCPVSQVGKFIAIGLNYADHAAESGMPIPKEPVVFTKAVSCIQGPNDPVMLPKNSVKGDWEVELGVVIGTRARYVSQKNALDYVAGFCVFNDISARDIQSREHANKVILLGKSFDTSCPLGPWLTTRDEIPDPEHLQMQLRLNGELRQNANTSEMIYGIRELVAWWSQITLEPGDVITSGSPAGVIAGRDDAVWLKPGDRIEATIERLGTLVSIIAAEKA